MFTEWSVSCVWSATSGVFWKCHAPYSNLECQHSTNAAQPGLEKKKNQYGSFSTILKSLIHLLLAFADNEMFGAS